MTVCIAASRASDVGHAIASIRAQTLRNWELLIIGQGEADSPLRDLTEAEAVKDPRIRYIHIDTCGLSRARNAGIRAADGELIAFTDDDCEPAPDWLQVITDCFDSNPTIGAAGGAVLAPPPPRRWPRTCPALHPIDAVYDPAATGRTPPPGFGWIGANLAIHRKAIEQIGLYDEYLGAGAEFCAGEDTDFGLRLETAGIRVRTTPGAVVLHANGWRTGLGSVSRHQRNYSRGNGALAAKLTLMGDPRGEEWLDFTRRLVTKEPLKSPIGIRRYVLFRQAYEQCMREYRVADGRYLVPRITA